jgi:hypothetical protein
MNANEMFIYDRKNKHYRDNNKFPDVPVFEASIIEITWIVFPVCLSVY